MNLRKRVLKRYKNKFDFFVKSAVKYKQYFCKEKLEIKNYRNLSVMLLIKILIKGASSLK